MYSIRTKKEYLFLGPAAYINHDCEPNVVWHSKTKTESCVKSIRAIKEGQEIVTMYSSSYFGHGNNNCACLTCRLQPYIVDGKDFDLNRFVCLYFVLIILYNFN